MTLLCSGKHVTVRAQIHKERLETPESTSLTVPDVVIRFCFCLDSITLKQGIQMTSLKFFAFLHYNGVGHVISCKGSGTLMTGHMKYNAKSWDTCPLVLIFHTKRLLKGTSRVRNLIQHTDRNL